MSGSTSGSIFRSAPLNADRILGHKFPQPTIAYCMTPLRFHLEIPVEALANLTPQSHQRMIDMLNEWIAQHKPVRLEVKP